MHEIVDVVQHLLAQDRDFWPTNHSIKALISIFLFTFTEVHKKQYLGLSLTIHSSILEYTVYVLYQEWTKANEVGRNALLKQRHSHFITKFYTISLCSPDVSGFRSKGELILKILK